MSQPTRKPVTRELEVYHADFFFDDKVAHTYFVVSRLHESISRAQRTLHDGVLQRGGYARGGADTPEYRPQLAAVLNHARFPRRRTPTFRARRILFTSCQTARSSAHRAVHLDGPNTKARACSWRHAEAQALGDGTEQRVYTFGRRSRSPCIYSPQVRASLVLACLRFELPKQRVLTKLFSLFDAHSGTVSFRRSMEPDNGQKRCALRIYVRCADVQDPFACTVLVARQRRVKLTLKLKLSFLRRASRWSAPSAKPRRRVVGEATGTMRTNRYA